MIGTTFLLLFALLSLPTQANFPGAFPRDGARQLIDNERVTVWDVVLETGKPPAMRRYRYDTVSIELSDTAMSVKSPSSAESRETLKVGNVLFTKKGATQSEEVPGSTARHAVAIELKDVAVPPLVNKSGYPNAFPRDGGKKLLDNARVVVWDYSWTSGKPTVMHFHDKDVVVVYLGNGDLSSTTPDGKTVVNSYTFGQSKFNARDRTHSELLVKGSQRVIAVELK
jgi:hypothetical protein